MPQDSATVRTALAARTNTNAAPTVAGIGQVVSLTLVFDGGKQFIPEDLHDALIAKYGAGKVVSDQDVTAYGRYRWRVKP
jgi:dTDP-4-dehydrorhamnose reductase